MKRQLLGGTFFSMYGAYKLEVLSTRPIVASD